MSNDGGFENDLLTLAKEDPYVWIDDVLYDITIAGKPQKPGGGEPKTDVYLLAEERDGDRAYEYKISVKKDTFEFYDNKIKDDRAADILGDEWSNRLIDILDEFYDAFWKVPLIWREGRGKTESGSFTLGWRFDITSSPRLLSYPLASSIEEKYNILTGGELGDDTPYDECTVDGEHIAGCGIANCIFVGEDVPDTTQDLIELLKPAAEYAAQIPDMYLSASAVNYRSKKGKLERSRWLLVPVVWKVNSWGVLEGAPVRDQPLLKQAGEVYDEWLGPALFQLGIETTDDIVIEKDDPDYVNCESWLVDDNGIQEDEDDGCHRWMVSDADDIEEYDDYDEYNELWDEDPWNELGLYA